ncbi:MAG: hypothetical protein JWM68_46 [Verrucomicrobiales bacterium]|nr:hypothetical protein [Verrucomicrobiales bacterium]
MPSLAFATCPILTAPVTTLFLISKRRILFKLWQRGIHLVPRMRVACPDICLRAEPTRIIQARRSDRDNVRDSVRLADNRRTAFSAKAPMRLATHVTGRGMEPECALQQLESFRRHDDERRRGTPAGLLAISTVTVKHHHRCCRGFVANRATSASA